MRVSVLNASNGFLSDSELLNALRAVNRQVTEDFAPYWHIHADLRLDPSLQKAPRDNSKAVSLRGDAILYIVTTKTVSAYDGYHAENFAGIPYGFVFADIAKDLEKKTKRHAGEKSTAKVEDGWTVTLSHEALELIADPQINLLARGPHPDPKEKGRLVYHGLEVCDAVQDESYEIDGIAVSNFVLPRYFTREAEPGARNDFLSTRIGDTKKTLRSFKVNPGGYLSFFDPKHDRDVEYDAPDDKRAEERRTMKQAIKARFRRRGRRFPMADAAAKPTTIAPKPKAPATKPAVAAIAQKKAARRGKPNRLPPHRK